MAWLGAPVPGAEGQEVEPGPDGQRCDLLDTDYVRSILTSGGDRINYVSGPVLLRCSDGLRVEADSVVEFTATDFRQLIGGVVMESPETVLRADRVHEFSRPGRVQAWGSVEVLEKGDSLRIRGDTLRLLRANRLRPEDELSVWGDSARAVIRFQRDGAGEMAPAPADAGGAVTDTLEATLDPDEPGARADSVERPEDTTGARPPSEPLDAAGAQPGDTVSGVGADAVADRPDTAAVPAAVTPPDTVDPAPDTVYARRIHLEGRTRFAASESVRIVSRDLVTYSDSVDYRRDTGTLSLLPGRNDGDARVVGDAYELTSRTIDMQMGPGGPREVEARDDALLSGQDIRLEAPVVRIFLDGGEIDRLVAIRRAEEDEAGERRRARSLEGGRAAADTTAADSAAARRAEALAEDFHLVADSIEVVAPGQRLETVYASGDARGEALGRDSLNTEATPAVARSDWIEGASVEAHFVPNEPRPGAPRRAVTGSGSNSGRARFRLDRLVATGSARSLYRLIQPDSAAADDTAGDTAASDVDAAADTMVTVVEVPPADTTAALEGGAPDSVAADTPAGEVAAADTTVAEAATPARQKLALHYVTGEKITIILDRGEVQEMEVEGQTRGLYLEPGRFRPPTPVSDTTSVDGSVPPGRRR